MTMVEFPEQTPEERAWGEAALARMFRARDLAERHELDQLHAQLHASIAGGMALGNQCVCGTPGCEFKES